MTSAILWYLAISLVGWLTFPLAYRLLPALTDRGYAFTRTLGLLIWAYVFWLLASLGVLRNDLGGLLFSLVVLIALSGWALRGVSLDELAAWLRGHLTFVLSVEALFLVAFAWMAVVRAANPEVLGTEKPMELAFINAILHSPVFPPHDPWLSGYAISYYYFGYVMVAMLAKLAGSPGSVAFNLGVTLVFALSAVGAYGVVYDLLCARTQHLARRVPKPSTKLLWLALLGPLFILLIGNMEGFLEVLHARGLFWQSGPGGERTSAFWKWLDMRELSSPPGQSLSWMPSRYLWWWRASRVLQDYDYAGNWKEIIDEFPSFSYLLADLHPHVLGMPFAFLAMALPLNLFLGGGRGHVDWLRRRFDARTLVWIAALLALGGIVTLLLGAGGGGLRMLAFGLVALVAGGLFFAAVPAQARRQGLRLITDAGLGEREIGLTLEISTPTFLLGAVCLGGLAFLNTWDFPFYVALFAGTYGIVCSSGEALSPGVWARGVVRVGMAMGIAGILLYLPFYLGFSSQAGGVLPNLVYPTRGAHIWVMFATLWLPLLAFLLHQWGRGGGAWRWQGFALVASLMLLLYVLAVLLAIGITLIPGVRELYLGSLSAPGVGDLVRESVVRRLESPGGWLMLLFLVGVTLGLILKGIEIRRTRDKGSKEKAAELHLSAHSHPISPHLFVFLLTLLGGLLALVPEFFYLRDLFGWRINTIFKFYYQAWLLWGVAAAYASAVLLLTLRRLWAFFFRVGLVLIVGIGLTYTILGLWTKTNGFLPPLGYTLDGTAYLMRQEPDEMDAVTWLSTSPPGVVAEAVGGSYTTYARVSELSGQPAVLGWDFHEVQWRGSNQFLGSRQGDVMRLYCTRDWKEAQAIIQQYSIRYIFLGNLERSAYTPQTCPGGLSEVKFMRNLPVAYEKGEATIYMVP